jgi:flagellar hook assembly protein FlgD
VTLRIYDIHGRYVRGLVDGVQGEGSHSVQWDGRNGHGERVSSGVYLMKLDAGGTTSVRKMLMIK